MGLISKIQSHGKIVKKRLISVLNDHEERLTALEEGGASGGGTSYDDTEIKSRLTALETAVEKLSE